MITQQFLESYGTSIDTALRPARTLEPNRRLIAAIIFRAIEDIQITPTAKDPKRQRELEADVESALRYLFRTNSPFDAHCEFIGVDADDIRTAILDPNNPRVSRTARVNYSKFLKVKYQ